MNAKNIRVVVWHGTTQEEHYADSHVEAMAIVGERHKNAYDPRYYDAETGVELHDLGTVLASEDDTICWG